MLIGGLLKTSLIDYPKKIAAVVFLQGCNFRCPYCHNPELVKNLTANPISESYFLDFLKTRKGKLDAVVISGGEPTINKDLKEFIKKIKKEGFLVKLDTNGTNPSLLQELIELNLIDYIAMDIKGPLDKYSKITNSTVSTSDISKSMELTVKSEIEYEFRTTVVKEMLTYNDFVILKDTFKKFGKIKNYYLQKFVPSKLLNENFMNKKTYNDEEFETIKSLLNCVVENVSIR